MILEQILHDIAIRRTLVWRMINSLLFPTRMPAIAEIFYTSYFEPISGLH